MIYYLEGNPIPLARPRFSRTSQSVYDSQKREKLLAGLSLKHQHGKLPLYTTPLHVEILFVFQMPRSWTGRRKEMNNYKAHTQKIDIDNLCKFIFDCIIGIVYTDDSLIASIHARKIWGITGYTEFSFKKID